MSLLLSIILILPENFSFLRVFGIKFCDLPNKNISFLPFSFDLSSVQEIGPKAPAQPNAPLLQGITAVSRSSIPETVLPKSFTAELPFAVLPKKISHLICRH